MPGLDVPLPERRPPGGVPRWLWPPPGATVARFVLRETVGGEGRASYDVATGGALDRRHLRALEWLLQDHPAEDRPGGGPPCGEVVLEVARTEMAGGRVGYAYALDGRALGDPASGVARGIVGRFVRAHVAAPG